MKQQDAYAYWKYPFQRWLVLILGLFQIPLLAEHAENFRFSLHTDIFSPEALAAYQNSQLSGLVVSLYILLTALGFFLIGTFCKSRKAAKLFESILFFSCAGLMAAGLLLLRTFKPPFFLCLFLLAVSLLLGLSSIRQVRREKA